VVVVIPLSDGIAARRFPVVTVALLLTNLAVWLCYELPSSGSAVLRFSFYPCAVENACQVSTPWIISWITAMFLHASWDHILGNMLFLAIFGKNVEDAFGHLRYLAFYFAGGLASTAAQTGVTLLFGSRADARAPNLGASGAIAAVLGAFFLLYPKARILTFIGWFPVKVPAWLYLGAWFLYQLVAGNFGLLSAGQGGGVAFFAHIGGFLFGILFARRWAASRSPGLQGRPEATRPALLSPAAHPRPEAYGQKPSRQCSAGGSLAGGRVAGDGRATPPGHADQALGLEEGDGTVGGAGGDGVLRRELDDGRQRVTGLQLPGHDLGPKVGRDGLVGSLGLLRARSRGGDDLGDGLRGLPVGVLDPRGVYLQGRRSPAAVTEPTGDGPQVHSGGQQLGGRVVP
jgi:membrane associated rhomboid family serine protease